MGVRVLLVDDEPLILKILGEALADAGFDVLEAASGREACLLVEEPHHVDLLVTDIHMPLINGVEVAQRARACIPDIPVLFISGRTDLLPSLPAPIPHAALAKPFTTKQLVAAVDDLLKA